MVEARPWLWYWHALSLQAARPLHARKLLMRTEREFARTGAAVARLLALAAIIDTHDGEWSDPASLPYWAGQLSAGLADIDLHLLEPDQDLRLHARLAGALLACAPESPLLAPAAERALQAMALVDNAAALLAAAQLLLPFCDWLDSPARANALIAQIARIDDDPALDPAQLVRWHTQVARWYSKEGDDGQAQRSTTSARRIVSQSALPLLLVPDAGNRTPAANRRTGAGPRSARPAACGHGHGHRSASRPKAVRWKATGAPCRVTSMARPGAHTMRCD